MNAIFLVCVFATTAATCSPPRRPESTPESYNCCTECPRTENVVWGFDGRKCLAFRNMCFLNKANCGKTGAAFVEICPYKCQEHCSVGCTKKYQPVCGKYNNKKVTFANDCLMDRHICTTGQPYLLVHKGACDCEKSALPE